MLGGININSQNDIQTSLLYYRWLQKEEIENLRFLITVHAALQNSDGVKDLLERYFALIYNKKKKEFASSKEEMLDGLPEDARKLVEGWIDGDGSKT